MTSDSIRYVQSSRWHFAGPTLWGVWRHEVKPIRIKTHQRPATSIFRYGFDWIRHALFNPQAKSELLIHVLNLLWQALTGPKALVYQLYPM
jgi:hypothetical protein